jgi:hypothetical protein
MASAGEPEKNVRTTCAMDDVPASSESDVHDLALAAAQRNERVGRLVMSFHLPWIC